VRSLKLADLFGRDERGADQPVLDKRTDPLSVGDIFSELREIRA